MSDDFYVFLTSNVFPDTGSQSENTIGKFITHIPQKLNLNDEYEVAIADISYTKSWFNIPEPQKISIEIIGRQRVVATPITLPAGDYATGAYLAHSINLLIEREKQILMKQLKNFNIMFNSMPKIIYESKTNKFKIEYGRSGRLIFTDNTEGTNYPIVTFFSDYLSEVMGFFTKDIGYLTFENYEIYKNKSISQNSTTLDANYVPQMSTIHTLYVYSDLIRPRIVGNVMAPLFRQIEVPNEITFGQDVFIKYRKRFYHPLNHFEFDTIQIVLKDDAGKDIDFKFGRVTVSLHFRKTKNFEKFLKTINK
jgi:hypothetical protein